MLNILDVTDILTYLIIYQEIKLWSYCQFWQR